MSVHIVFQIEYLDQWNKRRREIAKIYCEALKESAVVTPIENNFASHVYHMYILQSTEKDKLVDFLSSKGIATGIYYPIPLHLQKVYSNLGYKVGDFPQAEDLSKRTFAIPMYPELNENQLEYITTTINSYWD